MCVNSIQAETRAEFAERTVAKLEKSIDDLEGMQALPVCLTCRRIMVFAAQVNAFLIQAATVLVEILKEWKHPFEGVGGNNDMSKSYKNWPQNLKRSSFPRLQRGQYVLSCFVGQHYLVDEPQGAHFMELLEQLYKTLRASWNAHSSPGKKGC